MLQCIVNAIALACASALCLTPFNLAKLVFLATGGADMAGADRDDLEQLERAVRGRLLEVQILKLSAQCRVSQSHFDAYLDVANTIARPKVSTSLLYTRHLESCRMHIRLCYKNYGLINLATPCA